MRTSWCSSVSVVLAALMGAAAGSAADLAASWDTTVSGGEPASKNAASATVQLAGTRSRVLLRFELPDGPTAGVARRPVARAELRVFGKSIKNLRHYMPVYCHPLTATPDGKWTVKEVDAALEKTIDYGNGRPKGALDSEELYGKPWRYWCPPPLRPTGVGEKGMWITFNVTPAVEKAQKAGQKTVAFCLLSGPLDDRRQGNNAVLDLVSNEGDEALRPRLRLTPSVPKDYRVEATHTLQKFCDLSPRYRYRGGGNPQVHRGGGNPQVHIKAARGEVEGFQVLLIPETKDLKRVAFSWTDLSGPNGARIAKDRITGFEEHRIVVRRNRVVTDYHCGRVVTIPDPLLPLKTVDCPRHQATAVYFNVTVPRSAPAGKYTGTLTIKPANAAAATRPLIVEVWDFAMPIPWNFHTMGQFVAGDVSRFYGKFTDEMWRGWYRFLLDHRFSPTEQYHEILSPRRDLKYCVGRGMNTIYVGSPNDVRRPLNMPSIIKRYNKVKEMGLLEQSLIYIGDESSNFVAMRKRADLVHAHCPGLKAMMGGSRPRKELIGYIDVWDPQIGGNPKGYGFHDKDVPLVAAAQKRGEEVYWYVAAGPDPPYPNVQMERPLIEGRVFLWMTWGLGATGFEYYCYNIWKPNIRGKTRWPDVPWSSQGWGNTNGDGMLFYPGPGGRPASSMRFETIRDGIEDWETLHFLRDCRDALAKGKPGSKTLIAEADKALNPKPAIYRGFTEFTYDPAVLLSRREKAGDLITKIVALIGRDACEKVAAERKAAQRTLQQKMLRERHLRARKELGLDK